MTEEEEEEDPGSMEDISRTARSLAKTGRYLRPIGERKPPSAPAASTSSSAPISGSESEANQKSMEKRNGVTEN